MYAEVVVDIGSTASVESFTYEIPSDLACKIDIGSCVLVPLASRKVVGFVVSFSKTTDFENTKKIITKLESQIKLPNELIELARWISTKYICSLAKVISAILPAMMQFKVKTFIPVPENTVDTMPLRNSDAIIYRKICQGTACETMDELYSDDRQKINTSIRALETKGLIERKYRIIEPAGKPKILKGVRFVSDTDKKLTEKQSYAVEVAKNLKRDITFIELTQRYNISRAVINTLINNNIFEPVEIITKRTPSFFRIPDTRVTLMDEQQAACNCITTAIDSNAFSEHLLYGVTASGKTEVYLRSIEHALAQNKTCLVLLPEIALTTQVMNIFKTRFGEDVAVLHSALSNGERYDEWLRISQGQAKVVLGARSAIFAPLSNIGLIIVDEEHESSYKQDTQPRYNGRDVAIYRAKQNNAVIVLGSATPSIESFYKAKSGKTNLIKMAKRIENRPMPKVHIADLRELYKQGAPSIFTPLLAESIDKALKAKRQVMLLQNRRAHSTMLQCRECGFVPKCPNCAVTLKYHHLQRLLTCHHCDYNEPSTDVCPNCGGTKLGKFGIGTEKVAMEAQRIFPEAKILRLDRDTTTTKGSHGAILNAFRNREADILVGTQMIAKGLDFPNVTLVGIISADTSLNLPDFRASERTFQLLSQVAGRAGRGITEGEVIIQTFDPENVAIRYAVDHDYLSFYESEIEARAELSYPPFASFITILSADEDKDFAETQLNKLVSALKSPDNKYQENIQIIGPNPAVISKLKGKYRYRLVLKSEDESAISKALASAFEIDPSVRKAISVDVDPMSML